MSDPVVIVGGGISGLTVALRLQQAGQPYELFEASAAWGGNIRTVGRDGYLYDVGPDSFLRAKPKAEELCRELGLGAELIEPEQDGRSVWVAWDGRLHPMPEGLSLGVPKRPWSILTTPLLSPYGKCRALLEPWIPPRSDAREETIAEFLSRRLGVEMATRLAAPLLAGVFAGDAERLSMDAAFGQLCMLERKYGSLFSGMSGGKSPWSALFSPLAPVPSPFLSLRGGLGSLIRALIGRLDARRLHSTEPVVRLASRPEGGYRVHTPQRRLDARAVVIAGPPWVAGPLVAPLSPGAAEELTRIRGCATATVYFALDAERMEHTLTGSGFIVPPGEGEILAATFVSSKWPGRAPRGRALVRAFLGGARMDISGWNDAQLENVAARELTRFLGPLGPAEFSAVHRYDKGTPQIELGHRQRIEQVHRELRGLPDLCLVGPGLRGVGIGDCIAEANAAAERLNAPIETSPAS